MEKYKVLGVLPDHSPSFWSFSKSLRIIGKGAGVPPTGLATVMAILPEERFEPLPIVDMRFQSLTPERVKESDLVLISAMGVHTASHKGVVEIAHKYGKPVGIGGPLSETQELISGADYIIAGEAEFTLPPFLDDFLNGKPQKIYTEESVRGRTNLKLNSEGKPLLHGQTPIPRFDLLDLGNYELPAVQYGRGCPHHCEFCQVTELNGRQIRTKTPLQFIAELDVLYNEGHRGGIFIVDDNIIGNPRATEELILELIVWQRQKNYPFSFGSQAGVQLAWDKNRHLLEGLVEAGMDSIFLGLESEDPEILKRMRKGHNLRMPQLDVVRTIQNAGMEVAAGFIVGNDGEKPEVFEDLYRFIQKAGIPTAMPGLLSIIPGTKLHTRLEREGRLRPINTSGSHTHNYQLYFEPRLADGFTEQDLIKGYKQLLRDLFAPESYYARCRVAQREIPKTSPSGKSIPEKSAILTKLARHQLFTNGRIATARYLAETIAFHPTKIIRAITDAVKFQHFESITNQSLRADDYILQVDQWYTAFVQRAGEISAQYQDNVGKAKQLISRESRRLLNKAEKSYRKLNIGFRTAAAARLIDLRNELQKYKVPITS